MEIIVGIIAFLMVATVIGGNGGMSRSGGIIRPPRPRRKRYGRK